MPRQQRRCFWRATTSTIAGNGGSAVIETEIVLTGDSKDVKTKDLTSLVRRAQEGDATALAKVRERFNAAPEVWQQVGNLATHAQQAWIDLQSGKNPVIKEGVERTLASLRTDLLGDAPTPLERLLVERIMACWLQIQYADRRAAAFEQQGGSFRHGDYWQKQQESAHRRYLAAIRTLAQVRRLLTPAVQVNIAEKQVNLMQ
jgi:hypothetical protein